MRARDLSRPKPARAGWGRLAAAWMLVLAGSLLLPRQALTQADATTADVVLVVDTSISMREPGMDPRRASLLVTKLFSDIVPGELSVVRLLDVRTDAEFLPRRETDIVVPCTEDPSRQCTQVVPTEDWGELARKQRHGALRRPRRADSRFKKSLESHLQQTIGNSLFHVAFRAGQGAFDQNRAAGSQAPQTLIWLSDGRAEHPTELKKVVAELLEEGTSIEAIVFGKGDPALGLEMGLDVSRVSTPAEMMKAFAGAFRRIVQAPFEIDHPLAAQPTFEMKRNIEEAWIVVYGDDTLGAVRVDGPSGTVPADHAAEVWKGAGAYRVAHIRQPTSGQWTLQASGGGAGVAYAVVQSSTLRPALLEPTEVISGTEARVVVAVRAGREGEILSDPEVLAEATLTVESQGRVIEARDDGLGGDLKALDGLYTVLMRFSGWGAVPVRVRIESPVVDRVAEQSVQVLGVFRYAGSPLQLDLGTLGVSARSCRPLEFEREHRGEVPLELRAERSIAGGHSLFVQSRASLLVAEGPPVSIRPGEPFELCLATEDDVASSEGRAEHWLTLRVAGSEEATHGVPIHLRWVVEGLPWWQRYLWLLFTLLGALLFALVVGGFVYPKRMPRSLAISFVAERDDLDDTSPQPISAWRGTGIGFYRHARAFLHADYRISGDSKAAIAELKAEQRNCRVRPTGSPLHRETLDGDWETVSPEGRSARAGDVYRVGESGPYFRISVRGK